MTRGDAFLIVEVHTPYMGFDRQRPFLRLHHDVEWEINSGRVICLPDVRA